MNVPKGNELKVMLLLARHEALCPVDMVKHDPSLSLNGIYSVADRMGAGPTPSVTSWHEKRPGVRGFGVRMYQLTPHGRNRLRAALAADAVMKGVDLGAWLPGPVAVQPKAAGE